MINYVLESLLWTVFVCLLVVFPVLIGVYVQGFLAWSKKTYKLNRGVLKCPHCGGWADSYGSYMHSGGGLCNSAWIVECSNSECRARVWAFYGRSHDADGGAAGAKVLAEARWNRRRVGARWRLG